jgi:diguanylate cyclase (GGDEF)-like protein
MGASPIPPSVRSIVSSKHRRENDSTGQFEYRAELALKAFMSMDRAVAIVGPDGQMLLANMIFDKLFSDAELLERVNHDARASRGKSDRQITLSDGRAFWVETIPMEDGWLISAYNMTERSAKARTDTVTKLGNRLMFHEQLSALLDNPTRVGAGAAILAIDLGRFKAVNESLGRDIGDGLLVHVADRLRSALGHGDVVARLKGDKFGIIQSDQLQPASADALARRLVESIGEPYVVEGHLIDVAANVGIVLSPAGGVSCEQVLKQADLALHRAKGDGHRTYRFFESAMDEKLQYRRSFETDLRRALALQEFALVYQPQFNLRLGEVTGLEALLRWESPIRGGVPPLEFIPIAEETGIITSIGEWVLRTACLQAATWPGKLSISVNVSAIQFNSPNFVATVMSALGGSGLDPRRLELEITESVMLNGSGPALAMLQNLRSFGVRVALDDFGTGYSSLGYLRSFPFDTIKIDQSFVRGQSNAAVGQAIVRAVASLGQTLGMATVAEGVETDEQMARVASDGCTDVQGYLISQPLPPERIDSFLRSRKPPLARGHGPSQRPTSNL